MKNPILVSLLIISVILFSSCSKEVPPVFEVYITFENAEEYNQIVLKPYHLNYGSLDEVSQTPTGIGHLFFDYRTLLISNNQFFQKVFISSIAKTIGIAEYLSINASLELIVDNESTSMELNNRNTVFPIDFNPEYGEAYEINYIVDIKNSLVKNGSNYDFLLGGDSRVVITKY